MSGDSGKNQNFGPVVFDVFIGLVQRLDILQGCHELLGLDRGAPVGLGLPVTDVEVEDENAGPGDESGDPVHEEHDGEAEERAKKGHLDNWGKVELSHLMWLAS